MEFGVQIEPQVGFNLESILQIADSALENGFSTLWFSDHFMLDAESTDRVLLDPWLLMTALVRENPEIRVGSLVFCNSYRPPALHAKMASTLDHLSGGRFEFGIGAGWKKIEYDAYGYPFPNDSTRIEQLDEAIQIIKGIWSNDKYTFSGKHYAVKDVISYPKPVQKPHPTIWVGTMKAREKMLRLTAKYGGGINVAWAYSPEACKDVFSQLSKYCNEYGREENDVKKSVGFWTRLFESDAEMETAIEEGAAKRGVSLDDYRKRITSALWGTSDTIVARLKEFKEMDVSHSIFMFPDHEEVPYIKLFGESVIPRV